MHFYTRAIHEGFDPAKHFGAVNPPVFLSSTFAQSAPGEHQGFEYARSGNPTRQALEGVLASIENGTHGLAFSSGLGATDCVMKTLSSAEMTKSFSSSGLPSHMEYLGCGAASASTSIGSAGR